MAVNQPPLFTAPPWTDRYPLACRVRDTALGHHGTVVDVADGKRLTIRWDTGHTATYGLDHLLEREAP